MENNNQQYLNPETYISIIQDLGTTIGNLNIDLSLQKSRQKELLEYIKTLEETIKELNIEEGDKNE